MIEGATVVHHIPGRLRVKLPRGQRNARLMHELREFVCGLGGVQQVEVNTVTGSILVHYHPESQQQIRDLLARGRSEPDGFDAPPELAEADHLAAEIEHEADFLAAHSELALHVVSAVKSLNREIRQATDNTVDLKVLLPAGLAVWAFFNAGLEVATPLWVTLGIFSFNSFVALHHPPPVRISTHTTTVDEPPAAAPKAGPKRGVS